MRAREDPFLVGEQAVKNISVVGVGRKFRKARNTGVERQSLKGHLCQIRMEHTANLNAKERWSGKLNHKTDEADPLHRSRFCKIF